MTAAETGFDPRRAEIRAPTSHGLMLMRSYVVVQAGGRLITAKSRTFSLLGS